MTHGIDPASVRISQVRVDGNRVGFSAVVTDFAPLGYALVPTDGGWRVDDDLTRS